MKVLDFTGCCEEQINNVSEYMINNNIDCKQVDNNSKKLLISDADAKKIENEDEFEWYDFHITDLTYDVFFDDEENSNNKGFTSSLEYCKDYIKMNNGTKESYFADYKGGCVSIRCNETDEEVYNIKVK